jgi:hypothetical protein
MTYTATGFSNPVRVIFDAVFQPTTVEDTRQTVAEHFRIAIRREKERVHLVERLVFQPATGVWTFREGKSWGNSKIFFGRNFLLVSKGR